MNRRPAGITAAPPPQLAGRRALPGFSTDVPQALITGALDAQQIQVLVQACLRDQASARQCVVGWMRQGHALIDIYLHGVTAAARLVGHAWAEDCLDFGAVTIASSRLHRLLYDFSPLFQADARPNHGGTVLIFPEPGAQHTMGSFMLAECFRRDGWYVMSTQPRSLDECLHPVGGNWIDLVAVSVSSDRHLHTLTQWVAQMRQNSPNPGLQIMVGGPMASVNPQALVPLGGDVLGKDAQESVAWARSEVLSRFALTQ